MTPEPPLTREELLTLQFYAWERRGRGWKVWHAPVRLEPPFRPFWFHDVAPSPGEVWDDAHRPTTLSLFVERLRKAWSQNSVPQKTTLLSMSHTSEPEEPRPELLGDVEPVVELTIALRAEEGVKRESVERFLAALRYAETPFAFEVVGTGASIRVQFACPPSAVVVLREQLRAHFPDASVRDGNDWLLSVWQGDAPGLAVDFGLSHEFMLPLVPARSFEVDPLIAIMAALADLEAGEVAVFQVLFQEAAAPWAESALRAVGDDQGGAFFIDAPHVLSLAREKLRRPLYAAVVRVAAQTGSAERDWEVVRALGGALAPSDNPEGNSLIPLGNDYYPDEAHVEDVVLRRSRRSGMLVNLDELTTLVHPPSSSVRAERLEREVKKTKAAPDIARGHELLLGTNTHNARTVPVGVSDAGRLRHTYVIGASGTGKSTLLLNMILQDARRGAGFAVLDPHGDLIDQILGELPEERINDVVLLDAADAEYPVGFNILSAKSDIEKNLLASDLVGVFQRLSTSWGDQMTSVLGNAILAFLESSRGGTLAELRRFLVEPDFRARFLTTVADPEVVYYWTREFPLLSGRPQAPLLTRLDTFLRPKLIRHMVNQRRDRLDFRRLMDERKIFLAKLAQGAIGEENAYLLGSLVVTKLHQMALGRQNLPETERVPFFLYIDEFHNFITPSMASILSGARKFGLGLVLSHQELRQVLNQDEDVASAVIANPYTRICFRLGDDDARRLKSGFTFFDAQDLQSLGVGEAIVRMERAEYDFTLTTVPFSPTDPVTARTRRERIVALSRERYARPREDVEKELAAARAASPPPGSSGRQPPRRPGPPDKRR